MAGESDAQDRGADAKEARRLENGEGGGANRAGRSAKEVGSSGLDASILSKGELTRLVQETAANCSPPS